jgi:hypothetical protein
MPFSAGPLLSDATIATVAECCGEGVALRHLSLNNASGLTDRTLLSLAKHTAAGLELLDLSWCRQLTDEGLGLLTDKCERMTKLRLWGCSQLTAAFLNGHRRHAMAIEGRPSRPPLPPADRTTTTTTTTTTAAAAATGGGGGGGGGLLAAGATAETMQG